MNYSKKDIFVLGTGLSHDGSVCLLKNGKICAAIEKERISRRKHDGGNDSLAINYCLRQAGITINEIELIVQQSNAGLFLDENTYFMGPRPIPEGGGIPIVSISHHLAHAYYAIGTCPFEEAGVFVLDGAGSHYNECIDLENAFTGESGIPGELEQLYLEKDSFYLYQHGELNTIYKDFSPIGYKEGRYPMYPNMTLHSIGGFYDTASAYCFGSHFDTGKLMGLAPYGRPGKFNEPVFELRDGRVFVIYGEWLQEFKKPVSQKRSLSNNFQYYADIAFWVQKETERAIEYLIKSRRELVDCENLCYTGGVALNAVANAVLMKKKVFGNIYLPPAAGDNGIAVGCAYYGWLEILKGQRKMHDGRSCFGKTYSDTEIESQLTKFIIPGRGNHKTFIDIFFRNLSHFVNWGVLGKNRCSIQFAISGAGNYFVLFEEGEVICDPVHSDVSTPDCFVFAEARAFILSIDDLDRMQKALNEKKVIVNGDMTLFMRGVDLQNLYARTMEICKEDPDFEAICFEKDEDIVKTAARLLTDGKIIAWFQGGCEFGPRALGNRSILADPRLKGVKEFINNKIKFREDFRPFAPATLLEHVSEYFDFTGESPYMILTAQVKEEWKDKIPDVVHVDNSSRIQTVTESSNKRFYQLIREFNGLTGIPILLNTSFNMKGMPIIETPDEALAFFFECALDCLIMGDFIVFKDPGERLNLKSSGYGQRKNVLKA